MTDTTSTLIVELKREVTEATISIDRALRRLREAQARVWEIERRYQDEKVKP